VISKKERGFSAQIIADLPEFILSRNLDPNMHNNALFFEKFWKIAAALGAPLPNPRWPPAAGGSAPRS